ncbi:hypothetical protein HG531_002121 [Fusarium graminearum]|nr:hypothetical protein HG531_002121 [Fusarium graminearum]
MHQKRSAGTWNRRCSSIDPPQCKRSLPSPRYQNHRHQHQHQYQGQRERPEEVGELKVRGLLSGAAVANVGDEHGGAVAHGRGTLGATLDGDSSTVHVHLTVTNLVKPAPGEDGLAGGSIRGNLEVERRSTSSRAVTDVGVDDLPRLALVEGQRSLARTTTVVSTTGDLHGLLAASIPVGDRGTLGSTEERVVALARKVATAGLKRSGHAVVDIAAGVRVILGLERGRGDHLHVCLGQTSQTEAESEGVEVHFVVVVCRFFAVVIVQ